MIPQKKNRNDTYEQSIPAVRRPSLQEGFPPNEIPGRRDVDAEGWMIAMEGKGRELVVLVVWFVWDGREWDIPVASLLFAFRLSFWGLWAVGFGGDHPRNNRMISMKAPPTRTKRRMSVRWLSVSLVFLLLIFPPLSLF